jgi:DNA repair protein RecO (recombination protein O)
MRSALAKGARRSSRRFGSAVDLFAQGSVQLHTKPGRDLDTLGAFDVTRARNELAADLGRFAGASAIAELSMRFGRDAHESSLFDAVVVALDAVEAADADATITATLAGAWHIVAELGFAPTLDVCGDCHAALPPDATIMFSHRAGGALCARCGRLAPAGRVLPPAERDALRRFLRGETGPALGDASARAHQRLLREFLAEHLTDGRPLRALELWEEQRW